MRGIRTAGVGLSLALSTAAAWAQAPAVTLGPIRVLDAGAAPVATVRGQQPAFQQAQPLQRMPYQIPAGTPTAYMGGTPMPMQAGTPTAYMGATPMPMQAGGDPLGTPKPTPNPMVTELRDQYGQPLTVAPTQGTVVPPPVFGTAPGYVGDCETGMPQASVMADPYLGGAGVGILPRLRNTFAGGPTSGRLTLTTDYLLWFVRGQSAPPLVTTSSPAFNGIIGQGDTRVLYGDGTLTRSLLSGGRFWANYWFPCSQWGLDGGIWFLGQSQTNWATDSSQNPLIARPFINVNSGQNFSELTAFPGVASGSINVNTQTSAWGAEANVRRALFGNASSRLDGLIGFKYFNLTEQLAITEQFQRLPGAPPAIGVPGALSGTVVDQFNTSNNFYGVNLGLSGEVRRGRWFANGRATVGLGQVYQYGEVNGYQKINFANGTSQTTGGGLLALPNANIGSYRETHFGVMPEVGLTLGYYITPNLRFGVGYNFLYLNSVIRPANLIDPGLDVTKIPNFPLVPPPAPLTSNRPSAVPFRTSDIAIQGLTFSLNWAF